MNQGFTQEGSKDALLSHGAYSPADGLPVLS